MKVVLGQNYKVTCNLHNVICNMNNKTDVNKSSLQHGFHGMELVYMTFLVSICLRFDLYSFVVQDYFIKWSKMSAWSFGFASEGVMMNEHDSRIIQNSKISIDSEYLYLQHYLLLLTMTLLIIAVPLVIACNYIRLYYNLLSAFL